MKEYCYTSFSFLFLDKICPVLGIFPENHPYTVSQGLVNLSQQSTPTMSFLFIYGLYVHVNKHSAF